MDKGGTDGQGKLRQSWVWGSAATVHRPGETPRPQKRCGGWSSDGLQATAIAAPLNLPAPHVAATLAVISKNATQVCKVAN